MTLVNKIIHVSGAQFYNTSSVYYIVRSPPQVMSQSMPFIPPIPSSTPSPWQSPHCCLCPWDFSLSLFCLIPPLPAAPSPANSCQPIRLILKQEWFRLNMKNFLVAGNHHNMCPLLKMIYTFSAVRELGHSLLETNLEGGVGIYILVIFKWFALPDFRNCILL